jgi:hypothetical protein
MASSSSIPSSANVTLPTFPQSNLTKLTDSSTYLAWLTQVLLVLRSHDLMGIVDGSEPCPVRLLCDDQNQTTMNPEYTIWTKKDQFLLSWLNITLFRKSVGYSLWPQHFKTGLDSSSYPICLSISS